MVCNGVSFHNNRRKTDNKETERKSRFHVDIGSHGCRSVCNICLAHTRTSDWLVFTSLWYSFVCNLSWAICDCCTFINSFVLPDVPCTRWANHTWCQHYIDGDRWRLYRVFCVSSFEKGWRVFLAFSRLRRTPRRFDDLCHNSITTSTFAPPRVCSIVLGFIHNRLYTNPDSFSNNRVWVHSYGHPVCSKPQT